MRSEHTNKKQKLRGCDGFASRAEADRQFPEAGGIKEKIAGLLGYLRNQERRNWKGLACRAGPGEAHKNGKSDRARDGNFSRERGRPSGVQRARFYVQNARAGKLGYPEGFGCSIARVGAWNGRNHTGTMFADRSRSIQSNPINPSHILSSQAVSFRTNRSPRTSNLQIKCKVGIRRQAPSDYGEFAGFPVDAGIDSISLNPDSAVGCCRNPGTRGMDEKQEYECIKKERAGIMNRVQAKVATVTGGAAGIGWEICLTLAKEGAKVAVTDLQNGEGRKVVKEIEDVAWGIAYPASDESKFVTGIELVIDGGYTEQ